LAHRLAHVSRQRCLDADLHVGGYTVDKRPLLVRDYLPATGDADAPKILLIGAIHGDELAAVGLVFDWMQRLQQNPDRRVHWRVAPCMNPDGMLAPRPTRVNADGVDLNRNFPSPQAKLEALSYWVERTRRDPRRFPGEAPASEPETRWLVRQIAEFHPDAIVSVHAPYGILDYDGPPDPPQRVGYLRLQPIGTYPGSLGDYAGTSLRLPVLTLELPQATRLPSAEQSAHMWRDLGDWVSHHLHTHSRVVAVTEAVAP
jgi:hypothetical protein